MRSEQDRADVLSQREVMFDGHLDLDPARLVFIDDWTAANMTRSHGRCCRGKRLRIVYPHDPRQTTTLVARLRMTGMEAPMVLDRPINGEWFKAYISQVLVPDLKPGDPVVMNNLSSHKRAGVCALIEAAGACFMFLPPHSPDLNPIEKAFAWLKAMLRKAGERTVSGLWHLSGKLVELF